MARTTISAWFAPEFVSHFKASAIFNGIGVSKKQEAIRCLLRQLIRPRFSGPSFGQRRARDYSQMAT
jgi:hypothetical protein